MNAPATRLLRGGGPAWRSGPGPTALVWIDTELAIIGRCGGRTGPVPADAPGDEAAPRRRAMSRLIPDPIGCDAAGPPADLIERSRQEHLRRFIEAVAQRIPDDSVEIVGPGTAREHLVRRLRERDVAQGVWRDIRCLPSGTLTERRFVARLRFLAGRPGPRRRSPAG